MKRTNLRELLLERTLNYGYSKWDFHLRSLLGWHRYEKIVDEITKIDNQGLVLDVGCGLGQITEMLHLKGVRAVGIDIGGELRECGIWKHLYAPFIIGDCCNLPFGSKIFNIVVCCGVLEHVYNTQKFLVECKKVLKDNGIFLCYFLPNKTGFESLFSSILHTDHNFYNKKLINQVFTKSGYQILTVKREHIIPNPHLNIVINIYNRINNILILLDNLFDKTPLNYFGDNWRVYVKKHYKEL